MAARSWLWHLAALALVGGLGLLAARLASAAVPGGTAAPGPPPVPAATVDFPALPGHVALVTANGHAVLLDGGDASAGAALVAFLRAQGVERLDAAFLTRPDDAFSGGLIAVLESLPVKRLFDGGWASDCALYRSVLRTAAAHGTPVQPARAGSTIRLGDSAHLDVLLPAGNVGEEAPGPLVLRLVAGQVRFLFAAGAGPTDQEQLLRLHADLSAQVLDVPRAGPVLPGFLEAVRPRLSVGTEAAADGRLQSAGTTLLDPARLGTVQVQTDGRGIVVRFPDVPQLPSAGAPTARVPSAPGPAAPAPPGRALPLPPPVEAPPSAALARAGGTVRGSAGSLPASAAPLGPMEAAVASSRAPVVSCGGRARP